MGPRSHPLWEWRPDAACPGCRGWHLTPSYGERLGGGTLCPLCRETASSEAEMSHPLEGRSATLERGGDCPAGPRGTLERGGDRSAGSRGVRMGRSVYVGRVLVFFESFPFFRIGRRLKAFMGPVAQHVFAFS